jgi:hypothetical protein
MTATAAYFGFRPAYHPSGILRPSKRELNPASAAAIYKGDPIVIGTDGYITIAAANSGKVDGIFHGCEYIDATGKPCVSPYWPALTTATDVVAWVFDDPNAIYEAQCDAAANRTDIGSHLSFNVGTPSTLTGLSGASLDIGTLSTTVENQFTIIELAPIVGNAWADSYTIVRVKLGNAVFGLAPQAQ